MTMTDITIPPEALEAAARAMAKAGYGFAGIELTDPYTADAEYWDHTARAACLAMLKNWPGAREEIDALRAENERLRAALGGIHAAAGNNHLIANIARAALEEKQ